MKDCNRSQILDRQHCIDITCILSSCPALRCLLLFIVICRGRLKLCLNICILVYLKSIFYLKNFFNNLQFNFFPIKNYLHRSSEYIFNLFLNMYFLKIPYTWLINTDVVYLSEDGVHTANSAFWPSISRYVQRRNP